jgi:hypothetical protein
MTLRSFRKVVYQYAELNNVKHSFDREKKLAGRDFTRLFLKRHKLSLWKPVQTSIARTMGFNKTQVSLFFENLAKVFEKQHYGPNQIYNMDESGFSTVPNHIEKVISPTGKKHVGKVSSAERGTLITIIGCISGSGDVMPPTFIFPRKRKDEALLHGAPRGSTLMVSDLGYINGERFEEWFTLFLRHTRPSADHPIFLILDNHVSHHSLNVIMQARKNFVTLLSIPPHTSHRLQPLDRGMFAKLKETYSQVCNDWLCDHPGEVITQKSFCNLFSLAFERYQHPKYGVAASKECGIVPFNQNIFTDEDFLPSTVTDQPEPLMAGVEPLPDEDAKNSEIDSPDEGEKESLLNFLVPKNRSVSLHKRRLLARQRFMD